jgi:HEAT repeat protein
VSRQAFDKKIEALLALRGAAKAPGTVAQLRKALKDKSNYLVSKAAALVGELGLHVLVADLLEAFDRHLSGGANSDPQCWAKNAIAQALRDLDHRDPDIFLRGIAYFQPEPVWGGQQDTAVTLRSSCALALAHCSMDDYEIMERLVDLLGDPERPVRIDAIRAMAQMSSREAQLALRVKAIAGDADVDVIGQCLMSLLDIAPLEQLGFVAGFLRAKGEVALEAIAALGECREVQAVHILTSAWHSARDHETRQAILLALGVSRHTEAMTFLLGLLESSDIDFAKSAIGALAGGRFRERAREPAAAILVHRKDRALLSLFDTQFGGGEV